MGISRERILLIESDPEIAAQISQQTLKPLGYQVLTVKTVASAIQETIRVTPDLVIANLDLPGLSGKDLLVALAAQGLDTPIIVIARSGAEADIIQAFRLGAADFLRWPAREPEIVSAVDRVLNQVRGRNERKDLALQLKQTNHELQQRVREMATLSAIGKAVTSITDHQELFEKIVEGAIYLAEADIGWLLLRQDNSKAFLLSACRNVPEELVARKNQPWDDGVSTLVSMSGESLSIHGEPLKRFKVSKLGQSALVVPFKVKSEVIGTLVVLRHSPQPFGVNSQTIIEAVADYATISLVNARLFRALEERALVLQQAADAAQARERNKDMIIYNIQEALTPAIDEILQSIQMLQARETGRINPIQLNLLRSMAEKLQHTGQVIQTMTGLK